MLNLITDRTQADADRVKKLATKGWTGMSEAERSEWSAGMKGAYNYTDLNRVETAVAELAPAMGVTVTVKTDWTAVDVPRAADMERYLGNLRALRAKNGGISAVVLPDSMAGLTWQMANNIEQFLLDVEAFLGTHYHAGELFCGEV